MLSGDSLPIAERVCASPFNVSTVCKRRLQVLSYTSVVLSGFSIKLCSFVLPAFFRMTFCTESDIQLTPASSFYS